MMKNESNVDRIVRGMLVVVFLLMGAVIFTGVLSVIAYILAVSMAVTAATGFCALYKVLGINTDSKK